MEGLIFLGLLAVEKGDEFVLYTREHYKIHGS